LSEEDLVRLRPGSKGADEWTTAEAAEYLDANCNKVYKWIARGELTARKIYRGRRSFCLIPAREVRALARRLASKGEKSALDVTMEVQDER
jgi:excisionase family DNA binding protein